MQELRLLLAWDRFKIDYTATHEMLGQTFSSTLDHFAWSEQLGGSVVDGGVLHLPDNHSDHCPIYCTLDLASIQHEVSVPTAPKPRPSWRKATDQQKEEYKFWLEDRLAGITVPVSVFSCKNVHCQDTGHRDDLDKFTLDVLETIQTVAEEVLPVPTPSNRAPSIRPGWLDEVKQYKETAYFWHQVWRSAGRPLNTELHSIMKKTRNIYHYQYKKCRKAEEQIKKINYSRLV